MLPLSFPAPYTPGIDDHAQLKEQSAAPTAYLPPGALLSHFPSVLVPDPYLVGSQLGKWIEGNSRLTMAM